MSSLMSRMMGLLGLGKGRKNKLSPAERRSSFRRHLRVEGMEERRLLAFGAVGGTVFSDVTDDGLTGDDTNLAAVTVTLVRDVNNDGLIDGGDTTVGTQATAAGGTYLFEDLTDGQYIVQQTAVAGLLQRTSVTTQVVTVSNDTG
ncbi:MAG: SdrD B-like domain-containing protein, partial [Planctomycetota bacterium]